MLYKVGPTAYDNMNNRLQSCYFPRGIHHHNDSCSEQQPLKLEKVTQRGIAQDMGLNHKARFRQSWPSVRSHSDYNFWEFGSLSQFVDIIVHVLKMLENWAMMGLCCVWLNV